MQVIYKRSIVEQIVTHVRDANAARKVIERIILTAEEAEQLKKEDTGAMYLTATAPYYHQYPRYGELPKDLTVCGVPVSR